MISQSIHSPIKLHDWTKSCYYTLLYIRQNVFIFFFSIEYTACLASPPILNCNLFWVHIFIGLIKTLLHISAVALRCRLYRLTKTIKFNKFNNIISDFFFRLINYIPLRLHLSAKLAIINILLPRLLSSLTNSKRISSNISFELQ